MFGHAGRVLRVDLGSSDIAVERLNGASARKYVGGSGLGTYYLNKETSPLSRPLGPENVLILLTGPFAATRLPTSARLAVVTKSPLTGMYAESDVGGTFGLKLKRSGFDGIIITGQARNLCYLYVSEQGAQLLDAENLVGRDTYEVDDALKSVHGQQVTVASIGPAGENSVKFASIMTDGRHARAAGRCGVGAVMGSKNLKAIAVAQGTQSPRIADPDAVTESIRRWSRVLAEQGQGMRAYGTAGGLESNEFIGDMPIKNWALGTWGKSESVNGEAMAARMLTGRYHCANCPIGCGREISISAGPFAGISGSGPEYETISMLGANCLVDDLEAICAANDLCNRYGLDTISTGSVIGFAMEAYERGLLSRAQCGGLEPEWGDGNVVLTLIEMIAFRRGIGDLLAEGVHRCAQELGGVAEEFAIHTKGLEFPAHDPRAHNSVALSYATSNRGGCHLAGFTHMFEKGGVMPEIGLHESQDRFGVDKKGWMTSKLQDVMGMYDSLKLCKFTLGCGLPISQVVEWMNAVMGWDMDVDEFMLTGERIYNLKRIYNVRHGASRKDDVLPHRITASRRNTGGAALNLPHLGEMLNQYYQVRAWDEFGIPTSAKLAELGLEGFL